MSKVAITYWDSNNAVSIPVVDSPVKTPARAKTSRRTSTPQWFIFSVVVFTTLMLCLTINLRAFSELTGEIEQNQKLSIEVDQLINANLALQEEVHHLKTDPRTVEREARKLGMGRADEKVLVPAN